MPLSREHHEDANSRGAGEHMLGNQQIQKLPGKNWLLNGEAFHAGTASAAVSSLPSTKTLPAIESLLCPTKQTNTGRFLEPDRSTSTFLTRGMVTGCRSGRATRLQHKQHGAEGPLFGHATNSAKGSSVQKLAIRMSAFYGYDLLPVSSRAMALAVAS